jgi:hypothetical protein
LTEPSDQISIVEHYRGVGIHDQQSRERIRTVVEPEVDAIYGMEDPDLLFEWCANPFKSPESRR